MKKFSIGVLGAGTWGMALARMLTVSGNDVQVWSAIEAEVDNLSTTRVHPNLPGMVIPQELRFTKSIEEVCTGKDVLLFAVPSVFVRATAAKARPYIRSGQIIVDVAKGIEPDTLYTMTEILADELSHENGPRAVRLVALSGPTHAEEVALDLPTTIVSASPDLEAAEVVQEVFSNTCMRVYTNTDIKGVELSGAMKNVIALGVGISTGLGYGDNARAALITRGIAEIARLGVAMGCNVHTFAGLAGIGDLIVTATSMHSRNNRAGILIGKGETPENAVKEVGMVVEGMNALPAALELAERYRVEMPIVQTVNAIVNKGMSAAACLTLPPVDRTKGSEYLGAFIRASLKKSHPDGRLLPVAQDYSEGRRKWDVCCQFTKTFTSFNSGDWQIWLELFSRWDEENLDVPYALVATIEDVSGTLDVYSEIQAQNRYQLANTLRIKIDA